MSSVSVTRDVVGVSRAPGNYIQLQPYRDTGTSRPMAEYPRQSGPLLLGVARVLDAPMRYMPVIFGSRECTAGRATCALCLTAVTDHGFALGTVPHSSAVRGGPLSVSTPVALPTILPVCL